MIVLLTKNYNNAIKYFKLNLIFENFSKNLYNSYMHSNIYIKCNKIYCNNLLRVFPQLVI